jgi:TPR repeat protein
VADQNHSDAQFAYGRCLLKRLGVPIDLAGADHYFELAADQNCATAENKCGFIRQLGLGVEINLRSAADY